MDDKNFEIGDSFIFYNNVKIRIYDKEKIIPIIKFGNLSTKYKDFYDLYWLIKNGNLNTGEVVKIMDDKIFSYGINNITTMNELFKWYCNC